ncbi:hypothetical protein, partial [uncultured Acetatifactor sp.]|uniref:hypothetical protein n=1 Tax=uncultured Acetatifactor sp. TaxID=1671927 RepID=UPI00272C0B4D
IRACGDTIRAKLFFSGNPVLYLRILKTARIYQIACGKITDGGLKVTVTTVTLLYIYIGKCF